jgi:arylsulfatase A-like enzyme
MESTAPAALRGRLFAALFLVWIPLSCAQSSDQRTSVLLIVVDTLRADHLGVYGYERPTSPTIDAWAGQGLVFENALAPSSWTLPSMASLLTGQLPSRHTAGSARGVDGKIVMKDGRKTFRVLPQSVDTIAEVLKKRGYVTTAFVTNAFLGENFGLDQGFDSYKHHGQAQASKVITSVLSWLDEEPQEPFFVFAHLFDPHLPYKAGPGFAGRFTEGMPSSFSLPVRGLDEIRKQAADMSEEDRAFLIAAYDEEIAYVDDQLRRLFRGLRDRGLYDSTLIILTSDHGEELFDHDGFEHGHTLYQELLGVPLVVSGPGVVPGRVAAPVSLLDVAVTILEAAHALPPTRLSGRSLLASGGPERSIVAEGNLYAHAQRAVVRWPYKLVSGRAENVFDLSQDANERAPLADDKLALWLKSELEQELESARAQAARATQAELDADTLENLRDLGYVDH